MNVKERSIALFIDLDNANITVANFKEIINFLKNRAKIAYGKIYGVSEKKHKEILEIINRYGFDTAGTMRFKKRNKSQLDVRIMIDAARCSVASNYEVFCVIAGEGDLVPLYSALKADGRIIIDLKSAAHEPNANMVDERIALFSEYSITPKKATPKPQVVKTPKVVKKPVQKTATAKPKDNQDLYKFDKVDNIVPVKKEEKIETKAQEAETVDIKTITKFDNHENKFFKQTTDFADVVNFEAENDEIDQLINSAAAKINAESNEDDYKFGSVKNNAVENEYDSSAVIEQIMSLIQRVAVFDFDDPNADRAEKQAMYDEAQGLLKQKNVFIENNKDDEAALGIFTQLETVAQMISID